MKILLSTAVWGRDYGALFAKYSLASQLSANNLPKLSLVHDVTCHIVTTKDDAHWLRQQPNFWLLGEYCKVVWDYVEDHGINPRSIPKERNNEKYLFLSRLQNIAIARSLIHDATIFNYADFIWADGSLAGAVEMLDGVDAVLSFCLPVNREPGKRALDRCILSHKGANILHLPPRTAAGIAVEHLHREAKLRFWDGPHFTTTPTYVLWPVETEGLVIRAYHQTALVMRVQRNDPNYEAGIQQGTLDGHFTNVIAGKGRVRHAVDSDQVLVFSLYDTKINTALLPAQTREDSLRECLVQITTESQRRFSEVPILLKRDFSNRALWNLVERQSAQIIEQFHASVPFDQASYDRFHASPHPAPPHPPATTISLISRIMRVLYGNLFLHFTASRYGRFAKRIIGIHKARKLRAWVERLVFGRKP